MKCERAITTKGRTIDFHPEPIGEGGMKRVYIATDGASVVCFFKDQSDLQRQGRLEAVIERLNPTLDKASGEYWKSLFCWPTAIVQSSNHGLGVVVPRYPANFHFSSGPWKGKEKFGAWFFGRSGGNTPFRDFMPQECGDWISYLKICIELSRAVRKLHLSGLAHSDLSSKNVLVDPLVGRAVVIDIDSLVVKGLYPPDVDGSPGYIAPEVLASRHLPLGDPGRVFPSVRTDLHALAVLVYQLLLFRHPLKGPRCLAATAEEDNILEFGKDALFIEHNTVRSNRPPQLRVPYTLLGSELSKLFKSAFEDGLHSPSNRPSAAQWERGLMRAFDSVIPCNQPSCPGKWFPIEQSGKRTCVWCGTAYRHPIPFLSFLKETKPGLWQPDGVAVAYQQWGLFERHAYSNAPTGELADRTPLATVQWQNGKWLLINEALTSLTSLAGNPVRNRQAVVLENGARFRLAQEHGGRLMEVKIL